MVPVLISRWIGMALATTAVAVLGGCGGDDGSARTAGPDRLRVVAGFFPLADAAAAVGGDLVQVDDLTPPGAEPHDLELTTSQVEALEDADLVIVLGGGFQPAVERVAGRRDGPTLEVADVAGGGDGDHDDGDDDHDADDGHGHAGDPHVWLDPTRMAAITERIADELADLLPAASEELRSRGTAHAQEIRALDDRFREGLAGCEGRTLVVQHEAFGWLAQRYGLEQRGISGLVPEQEADPRRLAELIDLVEDRGVTVVFTEANVDPGVAETLAREAGVRTAVLDPLEARTRQQEEAGETYLSLMEANLAALRDGLRC